MRRLPVVALALAVVASTVGLLASPVSAGPGPDYLTITSPAPPATYTDGEQISILLNINEGDNDAFSATLETNKSGSFQPITGLTNKTTNSYGKYTFTYSPTGAQDVRATWVQSGATRTSDVLHLAPQAPPPPGVIVPNGPDTGNLTESPSTHPAGSAISITADFPDGTFPITLYKEGPADTWTAVATKTSSSTGKATFTGFPVTSADQRVFARKANNNRTEVDVISPTRVAALSIKRDCTGNTCGSTATASGALNPAQEGRVFKLQRLSGSSWVSVGGTATTGADGKAQIPFSLSGVPQWTTRTYRLTSAALGSSPAVTSPQIKFMPGPVQLGANVLRVDVDKGIYPTTKGAEYTGVATLSTDGTTSYDHVPLENFGVRGNSTAKAVKKPYKLKFLDKPPKGATVFGMPRGKSWTLLANFKDNSLVRDKVGLELGRRMNHIAWTPQSRYVEMFVNDQYMGSYLMTESVKIDGDRVKVDETNGMIMETDGESVLDSSLGFMSTLGKIVFKFKDPDELKDGGADPTGVTPAKLTAIKDRINAFESKLYNADTRTEYPDFIDVASAIDFHLVQEFVKNSDGAFWRSHYFSWDPSDPTGTSGNPLRDGKFHFGPVWDFDGSAGNACTCGTSGPFVNPPEGWVMRGTGSGTSDRTYRTHWFVQLFKDPAFEPAVKARWAEIKAEFAKVFQTDTADYKAAVGVGAANDRARWAGASKPRPSRGSFDLDVAWVTNWYEDRYTWMDEQLSN